MAAIQERIDTLLEVVDNWLQNENEFLMEAAGRTVDEGYFASHDVKYALRALKKNINRTALEEWIERIDYHQLEGTGKKNVLCLHAGNIPLVGFQDAFCTLLSGERYTGKISRKDPYLLPTFLNEAKKTALWSDVDIQWAHRLDDFEDMRHDAVLFAGSESSVPDVMEALTELRLVTDQTRYLIRTAHFSMAYFDQKDERILKDLTKAIFRYGGKGCRSVAIVVSPFSLEDIKCEFTDYIESFWLDNPQHLKPSEKLYYQYAYNKSIERPQAWLDDFLLQEGGLEFEQDFTCYWVQGDEMVVAELASQFQKDLQSIYIPHPEVNILDLEGQTEFLSDAQSPPIDWKPDGTDTLQWLVNR